MKVDGDIKVDNIRRVAYAMPTPSSPAARSRLGREQRGDRRDASHARRLISPAAAAAAAKRLRQARPGRAASRRVLRVARSSRLRRRSTAPRSTPGPITPRYAMQRALAPGRRWPSLRPCATLARRPTPLQARCLQPSRAAPRMNTGDDPPQRTARHPEQADRKVHRQRCWCIRISHQFKGLRVVP